ncbi:hypothetical protein HYC85_030183 [Camellia sinensis]|uniref:Peptidyl-prolyl cis-trans isomerase n=1 Tax=Camellia sinensis TaxID=4442 RepID=A0A7J7G009_CAMSI|nr:hypothetical protein HYC85_030183 [Camellia sinensis]
MCKDSKPKKSGGKGMENRQREEMMILLQKVKEKERRQMGLAPTHMSKVVSSLQSVFHELLCFFNCNLSRIFEGAITLTSLHCFSVFFFQLPAEYSKCPSGKKGGDLGWFPCGKMAGLFQDVAFSTTVGATSAPFKSAYAILIPDFCSANLLTTC